MELTVLVDNNTLIDRYFLAEPGVSYYIEIDDIRVLFDTGYSRIFISNAAKMGIDLCRLDAVVLSHAHLDHTWGLQHLIQYLADARFENRQVKPPRLVAHPSIFFPRTVPRMGDIGCLLSEEKAGRHFELDLSAAPLELHPKLVFLGEIERRTPFEAKQAIGSVNCPDGETEDFLLDDSALVYRSPEGLVVITGCAHAGICNTVEHAMAFCGDRRIVDIIGGFHLLNPTETQLEGTLQYFKKWNPRQVHAAHCTDQKSKSVLSRVAALKEVGVGLTLSYP
jgi:7,8-dihydropterin-6-yl-methyl-4-(beta-D-ribofuranosyl)aminobenzene 5'-phosphate synthase